MNYYNQIKINDFIKPLKPKEVGAGCYQPRSDFKRKSKSLEKT